MSDLGVQMNLSTAKISSKLEYNLFYHIIIGEPSDDTETHRLDRVNSKEMICYSSYHPHECGLVAWTTIFLSRVNLSVSPSTGTQISKRKVNLRSSELAGPVNILAVCRRKHEPLHANCQRLGQSLLSSGSFAWSHFTPRFPVQKKMLAVVRGSNRWPSIMFASKMVSKEPQ